MKKFLPAIALLTTLMVGQSTVAQTCKADFSTTLDSANQLKVHFTNLSSTSSTMKYYWDFGDGSFTPPYNSKNNPTHTYKTIGNYYVRLHILDSGAICNDYIFKFVDVGAGACKAQFADSVDGNNRNRIFFNNISSYTPTMKYLWDFGDGRSSSSTLLSLAHTYNDTGTYNVCLYISDTGTRCYDTICKSITIASGGCSAFFVATDTTQKFKLFLINKSTHNSTTAYYWDFGDGDTSTTRNPTHRYNSFGKFRVFLTLYDSAIKCISHYWDSLGLDSNGKMLKVDGFEIVVQDEGVQRIDDLDRGKIKLYPNPVSNKLFISFENNSGRWERLEILNGQGQMCFGESLKEANLNTPFAVSTQGFAQGIYFVRIIGDGAIRHLKFIKE